MLKKSTRTSVLVSLALCLGPAIAPANDIEPGKEFYSAIKAPHSIELDGDLSEWQGAALLADPRFSIPKGSGDAGTLTFFELHDSGGPGTAVWTGPDDHTSAVQIVYDDDNVYFGFVVTDEYHENAANSAWNGNSVQLMIANNNQNAQIALYNYALGGIEDATGGVVILHEAGPGGTEAVVTRNSTTKRTIYEIKLPMESLGLTEMPLGTQFGLGMAINDGDLEAPGQQGWGGLGAHSIVFGKTPQQTALVTLGVGGTGSDLMFLSAISTTLTGVTFRATDKGTSIVDPRTAKLTVDGEVVPLAVSPKNLDATDFSYVRPTSFAPATDHTYAIEIKDTRGNVVTSAGNFRTEYYAILDRPMQAVSVDTSKRGFVFRMFQNEAVTPTNLSETELALAGQLVDPSGTPITENLADPLSFGPALAEGVAEGSLFRFEIESTINLNQSGGGAEGNFPDDAQMPGLPGTTGFNDGVHGEIVTFVNLPAGWNTLGVNSDDGFRTQAGFIKVPADGILLGEFNAPRGANDTNFRFFVQDAGVYPLRTIWQEGAGGASIEIYSLKADGSKVLLNDTDNGGLIAYRSGVAPDKGGQPPPANLGITLVGNQVELTWSAPMVLQQSTTLVAWSDIPNATSPYRVAITPEVPALYFRLRP
ncbi:MAG: sugar-binding protein [Verrucomicrobiales bacterium]